MHHLISQLLVDRNDAEFQEVFITSLWRAARRNLRGNVEYVDASHSQAIYYSDPFIVGSFALRFA